MSVRPPSPPRLAAAALVAALALVAAAATALPEAPFALLAPLAAHAVHLLAAFALGRALLRVPGAAPRQALDIVVSSLAAGLAGLALLSLGLSVVAGSSWWTPWVVDASAIVAGLAFGRLRDAADRVAEPWRRRDLEVIVASRLPLLLGLCLVGTLYLIPPFLPPTPGTGAAALAFPAQAALRGGLGAASLALPGSFSTPSQVLLLHGWLTGGHAGALLFGATFLALLAAAVWLHADRHLGERAAAWSALLLLSAPLLLPAAARDPSLELLLLYAFLSFHEIADWCQKATGGKVALASVYGGVLAAESPRGLVAFAVVMAFMFLVQALIDRNGVLRQVPGLLGMSGIALLVAVPFVALAASAAPEGLTASLVARHVPASLRHEVAAPATTGSPSDEADDDAPDSFATVMTSWSHGALLLGPLLLGLLAALPLLPLPPEPVRHAVLGGLLFGASALLPAPYGGEATFLLAPATLVAGGTAVALLARPGIVARATALFGVVALPFTIALALATGPDVPLGAGVLLGRTTPGTYLKLHAPDAALIEAARVRGVPEEREMLLVGNLTDVQYRFACRRSPGLGRGVALEDLARRPDAVEVIALDRRSASRAEVDALKDRVVLAETDDGRYALLSVALRPAPDEAPAETPAAPAPPPAAAPRRQPPR